MASKSLTYLIYDDLVKAVDGIGKKTFLGRPKTVSGELVNFIVIQPMTTLQGRVAGKRDVMVDCYGIIDIYSKAKTDGTLNVSTHTTLVQKVLDKFDPPYNGDNIVASNPKELLTGDDKNGYQVTKLTLRIRTKFNVRK